MTILNYQIKSIKSADGYYGVAVDLWENEIFRTDEPCDTPEAAKAAAKQIARDVIDSALRVAGRELGGAA